MVSPSSRGDARPPPRRRLVSADIAPVSLLQIIDVDVDEQLNHSRSPARPDNDQRTRGPPRRADGPEPRRSLANHGAVGQARAGGLLHAPLWRPFVLTPRYVMFIALPALRSPYRRRFERGPDP